MIIITITDYRTEKNDKGWIELNKDSGASYVESIDELKEKASENYGTVVVYNEIPENDIAKFSPVNSNFNNISLARIKNTFFIFGKKEEKEFMEFFEKDIAKSLESVLNLKTEHLKNVIKEYEKIIDDVHKEKEKVEKEETASLKPLDELSRKNEEILPFLKQDEKHLEHLKSLAKTEKYNGVFNSLLREIEEDNMYGLRTSIKTCSDAANLLYQHHSQQEMIKLEKTIEYLYLFIGTFYVVELILLLYWSDHGSDPTILFNLSPFMSIALVIAFSFSFVFFILYHSKIIMQIKRALIK